MIVYLLLLILTLYLSYRLDGQKTEGTDVMYMGVFMLIVFVIGLSRELGGDKMTYIEFYENCPTWADKLGYIRDFSLLSLLTGYMPLWTLLNVTVKSISPNDYTLFQFVHAIYVNGAFLWFFKRYSNCKYLCVALFIFIRMLYFNCETMRESIAIATFILAFPYLISNQRRKYYRLMAFALMFHISACVAFIFPFIPKIHFNFKRFCIAGVVSTVSYLFMGFVLLRLLGVLESLGLGERYSEYLASTGNFNGFVGNYIAYLGVPWFVYDQMRHNGTGMSEWQETIIEKYLLFAPIVVSFITLNRFFEYFSIISICIFAYYVWEYSLLKRTFPTAILVLMLVVWNQTKNYYARQIEGGYHQWDMYLPYTTVFDNTPTYQRKIIHDITLERGKRMERTE